MDALEILKTDHNKVRYLFQELEMTDSDNRQRAIFQNIKNELEMHSYLEESVFYPVFSKYPNFQRLIQRFYQVHELIEDTLQEIHALPENSGVLKDRVRRLSDQVHAHVTQEETELFPMIRSTMKRPEREALGRHIQAARHEKSEAA